MSSWTFIAFVNQELWPILSAGSVALDWTELVVGGLVRAGDRWSGPSWWSVVSSELVVGFFLLFMYFTKYNQSSILR
jgi:hypothetical protein